MPAETASAAILLFRPKAPLANIPARLSFHERVRIAEWQPLARLFGLTRMVMECEAEQGGFLLIYAEDKPWAAYGIGVEHGRFIAWRPATGVTFGAFEQLGDALAAVIANRVGELPIQA